MKQYGIIIIHLRALLIAAGGMRAAEPQPITAGLIKDGEFDPEEWGKVYPLEYESWLKTKDPKPTDKSRYKRGMGHGQNHIRQAERVPLFRPPLQRLGLRRGIQRAARATITR